MPRTLLDDAFEHHFWATLRLFDACSVLDDAQLATNVPGTYGPILDTLRHLVGADASYLATVTRERFPRIDEAGMLLPELRSVIEWVADAWTEVLAGELDPEAVVVRHADDGAQYHAPLGIRLAQVVHHGTDHRSQVCTALTSLGIEPPEIDVWSFGAAHGRVREVPPATPEP